MLIKNDRWSFGGILVRLIRKSSLRKLSRKLETAQFSVIELKLVATKMFVGAGTSQLLLLSESWLLRKLSREPGTSQLSVIELKLAVMNIVEGAGNFPIECY